MNKFLIIVCLLIATTSCKSPEARKPISKTSGSFIKESVERNKERYAKEQKLFETIMQNKPEHNYIASQSGFWYYYNNKTTDSIATPRFGDTVNFN
ncbi:MAG: gliding motility-associated peptidyl-prolyl isomerase GldI, partial [Oceanihabitans sp.]